MTYVDTPDIGIGRSAIVRVDGRLVLVCRVPSGWRASDAVCPHQRRLMDGARVIGGTIACPWHGARFDLDGGQSLSPDLTTTALRLYNCEERGGRLVITLD